MRRGFDSRYPHFNIFNTNMPIILDGKKLSEQAIVRLADDVRALPRQPKLVIIQIGDVKESNAYINRKKGLAQSVGIAVEHKQYPADVAAAAVIADIGRFNAEASVDGIMVQLPISEHLNARDIIASIDEHKDVDGLTPKSSQRMIDDDELFLPATTKGIITLLGAYDIPIAGKKAVIVGRSALVGRPTALAFLNRKATVTICHTGTQNLAEETRKADILIVATGRPDLIGVEHVSPGQTVIDVGITVTQDEGIVGDVDFDAVSSVVGAITPVPGGIGPMTVLSLMENVVQAARLHI